MVSIKEAIFMIFKEKQQIFQSKNSSFWRFEWQE